MTGHNEDFGPWDPKANNWYELFMKHPIGDKTELYINYSQTHDNQMICIQCKYIYIQGIAQIN